MIKILLNLQPTAGLEIFISDQKDFAVWNTWKTLLLYVFEWSYLLYTQVTHELNFELLFFATY